MKKFLILVPILLALILALRSNTGLEKFSSPSFPLTFSYPKGYVAEEKGDRVILMLKEDYDSLLRGEREGGEGPPTITIRVIDNPNNPGPRAWAEQYPPQSNYNLKTSAVESLEVSGYPAISYSADGLYPNRNVIIDTDSRLFYINGSYLSQDSSLYRDFASILASIKIK